METGLLPAKNWSVLQKLLFRFFAVYFFIYIFPFPIEYIPFTHFLSIWYNDIWNVIVPWAAKNILHVGYLITVRPNGSGDTTYNYVQLFLFAAFAMIAAIIWSVADRKIKSYDLLLYWLMVYVRYYLAFMMISYGSFKIFKTQFPFPLKALNETYGQFSPMGLLWNFMGYSTPYNMFTGIAEAAGGIFLLFRRTSTFGSLLSITVLTNIVALNFCYDVPVKLFSGNLLLMAIFIAVPDMQRLVNFFFRNKAVPAINTRPQFYKQWMTITRLSLKTLIIGTIIYVTINNAREYKISGDRETPKMPLLGMYNVTKFVRNKSTLPQLSTDTSQWKQFDIISDKNATIKMMNDSLKRYNFFINSTFNTLTFYQNSDPDYQSTLYYLIPDATHLILAGKLKDDSVYIEMKNIDMRLIDRGFHWINEHPYNR